MIGTLLGALAAKLFGRKDLLGTSLAFGWMFWGMGWLIVNHIFAPALVGGSLGKYLTGTKLVDAQTGKLLSIQRAAFRNSVQIEVYMLLGLGFLSALVDSKRRTVTDRLSGSVLVMRDATYPEHAFLKEVPAEAEHTTRLPWAA